MILFLALASASPVHLPMSHRASTATGSPVTGNHNVVITLRSGPSDTDPSVHTETIPTVPVTGGLLTVDVGSVVPLDSSVFAEPLWFSVQVGNGQPSALAPVRTVPTAVFAETAGRVGTDGPACSGDASDLGALRMVGDTLQGCTSMGWLDLN